MIIKVVFIKREINSQHFYKIIIIRLSINNSNKN